MIEGAADLQAAAASTFTKTSFVQLMLDRERKGGLSLVQGTNFSPHSKATTYINAAKRSRTNAALVKLRNLSENARRTNQVQTANRIVEDERVFTSLYSDLEHDRGVCQIGGNVTKEIGSVQFFPHVHSAHYY